MLLSSSCDTIALPRSRQVLVVIEMLAHGTELALIDIFLVCRGFIEDSHEKAALLLLAPLEQCAGLHTELVLPEICPKENPLDGQGRFFGTTIGKSVISNDDAATL